MSPYGSKLSYQFCTIMIIIIIVRKQNEWSSNDIRAFDKLHSILSPTELSMLILGTLSLGQISARGRGVSPLAGVESPMSLLKGTVFIHLCQDVAVIGWKISPSLLS